MQQETFGPKAVKRAARALKDTLSECGADISLGVCREAVSKLQGMRNWDTLLGLSEPQNIVAATTQPENVFSQVGPHPVTVSIPYIFEFKDDTEGWGRPMWVTFTPENIAAILMLQARIPDDENSACMPSPCDCEICDCVDNVHLYVTRDGEIYFDADQSMRSFRFYLEKLIEYSHIEPLWFLPEGAQTSGAIQLKSAFTADAEDEIKRHKLGKGKLLTGEDIAKRSAGAIEEKPVCIETPRFSSRRVDSRDLVDWLNDFADRLDAEVFDAFLNDMLEAFERLSEDYEGSALLDISQESPWKFANLCTFIKHHASSLVIEDVFREVLNVDLDYQENDSWIPEMELGHYEFRARGGK